MQKKTTMTDIAKALGVSQTLVSFVLSGKTDMGISPETKKKVLRTAEKMGYCSKAASKMLKLGRSGYAALIFQKSAGGITPKLIGNINKGLREYGYLLTVPGNPDGDADYTECKALYGDSRVDGFIVFGSSEGLSEALGEKVPIVAIDASDADSADIKAKLLCERILSCDGESDAVSREVSKNSRKSVSAKNSKTKVTKKPSEEVRNTAEEKQETPSTRKKEDSIWLL